jgi:hypothetical protein
MDEPNDLRCFCHNRPRLATFGIDESGEPYIHVKVYKGGKVYGEIVVTGPSAIVRLRCRACFRWHRVNIRSNNRAVLELDRTVSESFPQP